MFRHIQMTSMVAGAMLLFAGTAQAAITNGFANGGFETVGTTTPAESWLGAASGYVLSTDARTGAFSAELGPLSGAGAAVMLQNSIDNGGLPPLIEGDNPLLSFYAKGSVGPTGNVLYALRYLTGGGDILSDSTNQFFHTVINPTTWTEITFDLGAVPANAVAAFIEFSHAEGPTAPFGEVLIDDLFLGVTVIPVPAAVWLFGSGLVGLVGVARRRKAA